MINSELLSKVYAKSSKFYHCLSVCVPKVKKQQQPSQQFRFNDGGDRCRCRRRRCCRCHCCSYLYRCFFYYYYCYYYPQQLPLLQLSPKNCTTVNSVGRNISCWSILSLKTETKLITVNFGKLIEKQKASEQNICAETVKMEV